MITYSYLNDANISVQQREEAKASWIDKLGIFKDEFDNKDGFITIDFSMPLDDDRYFSFTLSEPHDLSDFIARFNAWVRDGRQV